MSEDSVVQNPQSEIENLLNRSPDQRVREYKYRFAQAMVFGLPVIGLQYFGLGLGGSEAAVWVGLLQAILAGWVIYVAAAGMLFEGLLLIRRRISPDLINALISVIFYVASLAGWVRLLLGHQFNRQTFWFNWTVLILILWCGIQWWRSSRRDARTI
jgi:cation transport ATPase